jgi:hypothetical protein
MAKRHLERYFTTAIGDRGFGTEGDLYSTEPMVIAVFPFLQGYRNSLGLDLVTGSSAAQLIPHYLTRIVPKNGQLLIPAYGRHQMFVGVSLWLFVTLYAKSTYKMPRQHTSNPKIPKVSKAIGSPFY